MWDSDPKNLQKAIIETIGPEAVEYEMRFRPMFGGIMAYSCGRPFASLSIAGIALKLSADDRARLMEDEDGYPLRYKPSDPPSKSYTVIPKPLAEAKGEPLKKWLVLSMTYCKSLPLKKRVKKKKKKSLRNP